MHGTALGWAFNPGSHYLTDSWPTVWTLHPNVTFALLTCGWPACNHARLYDTAALYSTASYCNLHAPAAISGPRRPAATPAPSSQHAASLARCASPALAVHLSPAGPAHSNCNIVDFGKNGVAAGMTLACTVWETAHLILPLQSEHFREPGCCLLLAVLDRLVASYGHGDVDCGGSLKRCLQLLHERTSRGQ